jgi:outer membrane cobalamin receptor
MAGQGHFIDSRVLRQSEHRRLSELLRAVRGVRLVPLGATKTVAMSRSNCPMSIWIDGIRSYQPARGLPPPDINEFPIVQLEGVEIYRGPAETPLELGGTGQSCGAIVLWTRRG